MATQSECMPGCLQGWAQRQGRVLLLVLGSDPPPQSSVVIPTWVGVQVLEIRSTSGGSARVEGGQRPAALLPTEGQPWGWPRALGAGSWVGLGPRSNFLCLWTDRHLSRPQSVPRSAPLTSSEVLCAIQEVLKRSSRQAPHVCCLRAL